MTTLGPLYRDRRPFLNFKNPFELLVATALSARCTDAGVNAVTPELFRRFPDPAALAAAPGDELEALIRPLGFYCVKAGNIKALGERLVKNHGGEVPSSMEELTALPGVGRKTASVVLSLCFGKPAIAVDTHFSRVCRRLGLSDSENPEIIEKHIAAASEREYWIDISNVLNRFGRAVCHARKPECGNCPVNNRCPGP